MQPGIIKQGLAFLLQKTVFFRRCGTPLLMASGRCCYSEDIITGSQSGYRKQRFFYTVNTILTQGKPRLTGAGMVIMIHDEKAEKLEQVGLYRRAAARWLTVLDRCRDEDAREWAARQRLRCLQQAETPRPVTDTFGDVRQAATALQKKTGLWQPEGNAFRTVKKHPPR